MAFLVGAVLALAVSLFASRAGFDRERGFYPLVLIVSAALYDLFAAMDGSVLTLGAELVPAAVFTIVALVGFKKNLWLVVAALFGHGLFDLTHAHLIANPGVPSWWPMFCLGYDIVAGLYLAWRLMDVPQAIRGSGQRIAAQLMLIGFSVTLSSGFAHHSRFHEGTFRNHAPVPSLVFVSSEEGIQP